MNKYFAWNRRQQVFFDTMFWKAFVNAKLILRGRLSKGWTFCRTFSCARVLANITEWFPRYFMILSQNYSKKHMQTALLVEHSRGGIAHLWNTIVEIVVNHCWPTTLFWNHQDTSGCFSDLFLTNKKHPSWMGTHGDPLSPRGKWEKNANHSNADEMAGTRSLSPWKQSPRLFNLLPVLKSCFAQLAFIPDDFLCGDGTVETSILPSRSLWNQSSTLISLGIHTKTARSHSKSFLQRVHQIYAQSLCSSYGFGT